MYHYMQSAEETSKKISKVYHKASLVLSNEMDKIFERFVTKHKLSEDDARKLLTSIKDKTSLEEIKAELRKGATGSDKRELLAELESPAYAYRLNRLEDKQQQIDNLMNTVYNQEKALSTDHYKELMGESYNRSMYEIQRQAGIGYSFDKLDSKTIDNMLKSEWSGANYSSRIWNNTQKLADSLKTELMVGLLTGEREADISKNLMFQFASGANNARRLVRTESCHIANEMDMKAYEESGIDTYVFVATLDLKTSAICASLDGKRFKVKDQQPGVNAPPMHPWCRSTTVPYFDDEWGRSGERAARGEDGKTYYVPSDMKYADWQKSFVDGQTEDLHEIKPDDKIKVEEPVIESVEDIQTFAEMQTYMKNNYGITVDDSVGLLDFQSVREGVQGVEYVMKEFPQAQSSFKTISTKKSGLMCAGYDGDINFNPGYYQTRKDALWNHGIGEGTRPSGLHPKGNNCFGSGSHEAGHILEKALVDKASGESFLGRLSWNDCTYAKAIVSDACKAAKKLPECKGMTNSELKGAISGYAKQDASECLAEAVCDVSLNGEDAAPLAKIIWEMLKKELG